MVDKNKPYGICGNQVIYRETATGTGSFAPPKCSDSTC